MVNINNGFLFEKGKTKKKGEKKRIKIITTNSLIIARQKKLQSVEENA